MKFLVVGLGSMGKRRIRNLQYLKEKDIIAFDLREDRRKEAELKYNIKTFGDINEALYQNPNAMIISTPPNHHLEYEQLAVNKGIHFFCEAGVFSKGILELNKKIKKIGMVGVPSCTLRFNDSIKNIKKIISSNQIGKVISFTYHMGQYLPDWHPWEDISKFYVGQRETSATREMVPFELEWLTDIFGDVTEISCMKDKLSKIKADIDDVYQILLRFKKGILANMLVDVVSRAPIRLLRVVGEEGNLEWDWMKDEVKIFKVKDKKWITFKEKKGFKEKGYIAKENMYIDEVASFISEIMKKGKFPYSFDEDLKMLRLLELSEKSSKAHKHLKTLF